MPHSSELQQRLTSLAIATAFWLASALCLQTPLAAATTTYAVVNVNVIPMVPGAKQLLRRQTVLIRDGEIIAMGKKSRVEVPEDAVVIDGKKKYLLPGLWDMHAHGRDVREVPDFDEEDLYVLYLANGITGIFDPWGFPEAFRWKKRIEKGKVLGPRFHFSSPGVDDETHASADEVESSVRAWHRKGYEWIKVHSPITREKFERLHAVARELGLPVIGHALRPGFELQPTLDQEPLMIAHIEEILSTAVPFDQPENFESDLAGPLQAVADRRTWVTTTVGTYAMIVNTVDPQGFEDLFARPEMRYIPPFAKEIWRNDNPYRSDDFLQDPVYWARLLNVKLYIARRLRGLGALDRLLLGTDSGIPLVLPGFGVHDELRLLVDAGLKPWEAILTGTYNPAAFLGILDEAGTVSVGKRADLLLVEKNPLRKIGNLERISGVMIDGVWLPKADLNTSLETLAERWDE